MNNQYDYLIIGGGIIGMAVARSLRVRRPNSRILIIEKENEVAAHSSGRNSGVLHAGFYYTADSFKARFTVAGNQALKAFCLDQGIPVNACGKLVVARDEEELATLHELLARGQRNGSNVRLVDEAEAAEIEPNVKTFKKALFSPDTASLDPQQLCAALARVLSKAGVEIRLGTRYLGRFPGGVRTTKGDFHAAKIINCAGLYADRIAQDFGFGRRYTMIPFKGLYLKYTKNKTDVRINIYPVPNLKNPFLGVHFTKTVTGEIKIGPTAIPAFWRENYHGLDRFSAREAAETVLYETKLFMINSFHFRDLAFEEIHKYHRKYFISLATAMVRDIDPQGFTTFTRPGIRAQLLDKTTSALVQDFVLEGDRQSIHVLNAVSPALTCAFPFADHVVERNILPE